ncbi:MAG: serine/threonine-protein kinase [Archangium sp.]|nr:serine/threonine-protein kinase [Archangium sp.]MDP3155618.1 serine/threonine-protein kinase [Archangium sp.]MDP3570776.1 serine/threonine-protein kinase [Archangium sp.]
MAVAAPTNAGVRALREHLVKDAPARESSVARFMVFATAMSGMAALALQPLIGSRLSYSLAALLGMLAAWYGTQFVLLRRGWFNPAVGWLNVAIEVSAPALIFLVDARARGPEYALTAPPLAIWGTLVALSALRGSRALAVAAGGLAAVEYLAVYFFVAFPKLPPDIWVTLQAPMIVTRAFLLFCSGLVTAAFVGHFNRRAEEALAAVRARDVLGKYLLHERIGAGGMAEVFRASYSPEGGFEKTVAVKKILPNYADDLDFIELFRREAALCSRLNHPNVVQVMDFGRFGDTWFLAMEHVDGSSLKRVIDAHKLGLPLAAVSFLAVELLAALEYVHARNAADGTPLKLVHRDVNPPNILVSTLGEVKLTDFGIASAAVGVRMTQAGYIKGKPGYLAPEQLTDKPLDGRTDLFSVGITLWEALTGRPLFSLEGGDTEKYEVLEMPIPLPSAIRPEVPAEWDAAVMQMLERDLTKRAPTARSAAVPFASMLQADGQKLLAQAVKDAAAYRERASNMLAAPVDTLPGLPG